MSHHDRNDNGLELVRSYKLRNLTELIIFFLKKEEKKYKSKETNVNVLLNWSYIMKKLHFQMFSYNKHITVT